MKTCTVNGYCVTGNKRLATAINVEDGKDAHWFLPDQHEGMLDAYTKAIAWTSPGV